MTFISAACAMSCAWSLNQAGHCRRTARAIAAARVVQRASVDADGAMPSRSMATDPIAGEVKRWESDIHAARKTHVKPFATAQVQARQGRRSARLDWDNEPQALSERIAARLCQ
jgi:hypothetical protein